MPRDGAITLSDYVAAGRTVVEIACARCDRRGRYQVARLMADLGDIALPDLRAALASNCAQAEAVSVYERCEAYIVDPL